MSGERGLFHLQKCGNGQHYMNLYTLQVKNRKTNITSHFNTEAKSLKKNKHQTNNRIMVTRAWEGQIGRREG